MRTTSRSGFTLVELVLATFVFAIGALALEATLAESARRMHRSSQLTLAASVARSRMESLAGSRCDVLRNGSDTTRSVISTWTVEVVGPSFRSVTQTVSYLLDGAARQDSYRALVRCSQ